LGTNKVSWNRMFAGGLQIIAAVLIAKADFDIIGVFGGN
jgi:hypothetical protein